MSYEFTLQPILLEHDDGTVEIQLYDIWFDDEEWCGSRRTIEACKRFMSEKEQDALEGKPYQDCHMRMRRVYLTFGEKWWYQIFKEMERSDEASRRTV